MNQLDFFFKDKQEFKDLDLTLSRINKALAESAPEISSQIIHIAGTNGKGSTAQFIANILTNEGYRTLLFVSPHINHIEERIQINLTPISAALFEELFVQAKPYAQKYNLSFFETIFLMAMLLAGGEKFDYIILETGMGGRFDATNTDFIKKKLPVITTIAQDHKHILGNNIRDIIKEKLGIVGENDTVFVGYNQKFILEIISSYLPDKKIYHIPDQNLAEAERYYPRPFSLNYLNAHNATEFLLERKIPVTKLPLPPCRQERFGRILLDGAHNPSGLLELLKEYSPSVTIVSVTDDRDIKKFCEILSQKVGRVILTTIPNTPRAHSAEKLKSLPYQFIPDPIDALNIALKDTEGEILVAGSFYLCGHVRSFIQANHA